MVSEHRSPAPPGKECDLQIAKWTIAKDWRQSWLTFPDHSQRVQVVFELADAGGNCSLACKFVQSDKPVQTISSV